MRRDAGVLNIGDIWISEEIGDLSAWGENVKSRVSAWEARSWKERILGKPKLRVYRLLKTDLKFEEYLLEVPIYLHRRELSRFRGGTNDLRVLRDPVVSAQRVYWKMKSMCSWTVSLTNLFDGKCLPQFVIRQGTSTS